MNLNKSRHNNNSYTVYSELSKSIPSYSLLTYPYIRLSTYLSNLLTYKKRCPRYDFWDISFVVIDFLVLLEASAILLIVRHEWLEYRQFGVGCPLV